MKGALLKPKPIKLSAVKEDCWHLFSKYIRLRDCLRTTGSIERGACITCGRVYPMKSLQAGHFIAGRRNAVLFSERGVQAQCYGCNCMKNGATLEYRRQIIKLYGIGADEELEREAAQTKKYLVPELLAFKADLQEKIKGLENC